MAKEFLTPFLEDERYALTQYEVRTMPGNLLAPGPTMVYTPMQQVTTEILNIADWLLKEHND